MADSQDERFKKLEFIKERASNISEFAGKFEYVNSYKNGCWSTFRDPLNSKKTFFKLHLPHKGIDSPHIAKPTTGSKQAVTRISNKTLTEAACAGKVINTVNKYSPAVLSVINVGTSVAQDIANGKPSLNTAEVVVNTCATGFFERIARNAEAGAKAGAIAGDCVTLGFAVVRDLKNVKFEKTIEAVGGIVGRRAGVSVGAKIGAFVGTAFGPVGTVIGGIAGGVIGGIAGSKFGEYIAPKIKEAFTDPVKVVKDIANDVKEVAKSVASSVKSFFKSAFSWF